MARNLDSTTADRIVDRPTAKQGDPILSVVIVNWNTHDVLARCLQSLREQSMPRAERVGQASGAGLSYEVIMVDNASSDGSVEMVHREFPWVRTIANRVNVGFARANNQAIPQSRGRYALLLNPDTLVRPGALETLVSFVDTHPDAGAAGARLVNTDGTLQPSCHPAPTLSRELWRLFHLDVLHPYSRYPMENWDHDVPREVDAAQGACLLLRRKALDQVGLLDEDYFIYSEEVDLCYRLREHGWKVYWVPQAAVVHHGGQSTRQAATEMFLRLYEGKVLYFRKRQGRLAARTYKLILAAAALARLLISPLAWLEPPIRRRRHRALAGHYRRLLATLPRL